MQTILCQLNIYLFTRLNSYSMELVTFMGFIFVITLRILADLGGQHFAEFLLLKTKTSHIKSFQLIITN